MRLIDADALGIYLNYWRYGDFSDIKHEREYAVLSDVIEAVHHAPTVDAVERKKGRWIDEPVYKQTMDGRTWDGYTYCSECREMHEYGYRSNFCPNCGAEMRKGEEE